MSFIANSLKQKKRTDYLKTGHLREVTRQLELVIVEFKPIFTDAEVKYPHLFSLRRSLNFQDIISCLLSISVNGYCSPSISSVMPWLFERDDDPISVVWEIIEVQLGQTAFNVLNWMDVDAELHKLLAEIDGTIAFYIPPQWDAAAFTFFDWLGNTTVVLLKDG